jgi:hypothetical protein
MRKTLRDLADARKELLEIQQEFGRLQKRIDAVRDSVVDALVSFGRTLPQWSIPLRPQEATGLQT